LTEDVVGWQSVQLLSSLSEEVVRLLAHALQVQLLRPGVLDLELQLAELLPDGGGQPHADAVPELVRGVVGAESLPDLMMAGDVRGRHWVDVRLEVSIQVHGHSGECLDVAGVEPLVEQLGEVGVEDVLQEVEGGVASCVAVRRQRHERLLFLIQPVLGVRGRLDR